MQRKRSAEELDTPITPGPSTTTRTGRVVKPKQWEDGQQAPVALGGSKLFPRKTSPPKDDPDWVSSDRPSSTSDRPTKRPSSASASFQRGTVPIRDESGKFAGVRPKTAAERAQSDGNGGNFKNAALIVLREYAAKYKRGKLFTTAEITERARMGNHLVCQGKTPEATMASALYTDVKKLNSNFIRPCEGQFGLVEWIVQGIPIEGWTPIMTLELEKSQNIALRGRRGYGSARSRYEAYEMGYQDDQAYADEYMSEDDEDGGESLLGPYSARLPCLPPRGVRGGGPSPGAVPTGARGPRTSGVPGLPSWKRGSLSRAASTGAVEGFLSRPVTAGRTRSLDKGKAKQEELGHLDLLLNAAEELHRSSSSQGGDDAMDYEPSTAGSPPGRSDGRDDARSRRGLRAAPPKSRKLQESPSPDSPRRIWDRAPIEQPPRRKRSSMLSQPSQQLSAGRENGKVAEYDEDPLRSPRSVAAKARYANKAQTEIALKAEKQGMLMEGFCAERLTAAQARLPNAGRHKHNEQVNILNLPLPDFDVEVAGGKAEDDGTPAPETSRQGTGAGGIEQEASAVEPSHANSGESGSGAPRAAVAVGPPSLADVRQLELKVEELEKEAGALAPQVGKAYLDLGRAYQSVGPQFRDKAQAALQKAQDVVEALRKSAKAQGDAETTQSSFSYLLGKVRSNAAASVPPRICLPMPTQDANQLLTPAPMVPTPNAPQPHPYSLPNSLAIAAAAAHQAAQAMRAPAAANVPAASQSWADTGPTVPQSASGPQVLPDRAPSTNSHTLAGVIGQPPSTSLQQPAEPINGGSEDTAGLIQHLEEFIAESVAIEPSQGVPARIGKGKDSALAIPTPRSSEGVIVPTSSPTAAVSSMIHTSA